MYPSTYPPHSSTGCCICGSSRSLCCKNLWSCSVQSLGGDGNYSVIWYSNRKRRNTTYLRWVEMSKQLCFRIKRYAAPYTSTDGVTIVISSRRALAADVIVILMRRKGRWKRTKSDGLLFQRAGYEGILSTRASYSLSCDITAFLCFLSRCSCHEPIMSGSFTPCFPPSCPRMKEICKQLSRPSPCSPYL